MKLTPESAAGRPGGFRSSWIQWRITHLPQIAAMADRHFVIEKSSSEDSTITDIRVLGEEEGLGELARLLGGDALTEAALSNAREMRLQAFSHKKK